MVIASSIAPPFASMCFTLSLEIIILFIFFLVFSGGGSNHPPPVGGTLFESPGLAGHPLCKEGFEGLGAGGVQITRRLWAAPSF